MSPTPAVVACVAENRPDWLLRVRNLAFSLRTFGGRLASAPMHAFIVDDGHPVSFDALFDLDVECHRVQPVPAPFPHANKLRMLEAFGPSSAEVVVALDCDIVVVRDFFDALSPTEVRAKPADASPLRKSDWDSLLTRLGVVRSDHQLRTTSTGLALDVPYVNSGVLFVPGPACARLVLRWKQHIDVVASLVASKPEWARVALFTDQLALTTTLLAENLLLDPLDLGHNFPTHRDVDDRAVQASGPVRMLHYHDRFRADGTLLPPVAPRVTKDIDLFNASLLEHLAVCDRPLSPS